MSRKNLKRYLGAAGIAGLMASQAVFAQGAILPIKKISADNAQQLVVEFAPGAFPTVPKLLDLPGPNHRIVMDFVDATIDKNSLPSVEELAGQLNQAIPYVKSVRYGDLSKSAKPTARVVIDLPEALSVKPRVVKVEEGSITISIGASNTKEVSSTDATNETIAAAPTTEAKPAETPSSGTVLNSEPTPAAEAVTPATTEAVKPAETPVAETPAVAPQQETAPAATPAPTAGWDAPATNAQPVAATSEPGLRGLDNAPATTPAATTDNQPALKPEMGAATPAAETPVVAETTAPTESKAARAEAVKRYNSAVQLHLTGKLAEAVAEYQAALQADPNLSEAHSNLGLIHNQQHNYAQALSEFRKALAINPKDAITYNGIGAALRAERDLPGAIKNWLTAVSLDPHLATAYYNLGTAYEIQKVYDKAVDAYKDAVKNDYRLGEAYYRMGLIMERKKRMDDAAQQFSQALKVSANAEYAEDARQRLSFLTGSNKKTAAKKDAGTQ